MTERPCHCNECHLCAVYAAAHGLPVKMPEKQPTLAEIAAFNDPVKKSKKKQKSQRPDDAAGLFAGAE